MSQAVYKNVRFFAEYKHISIQQDNNTDNGEPSVVQLPFNHCLVLRYLHYVQQSERGIEFDDFKNYLLIMVPVKKMSAV
jgi:hypothetical protein